MRATSLFGHADEMSQIGPCGEVPVQKVSSSGREQREQRLAEQCWDCLLWWVLGLNCSRGHYQLEMSIST